MPCQCLRCGCGLQAMYQATAIPQVRASQMGTGSGMVASCSACRCRVLSMLLAVLYEARHARSARPFCPPACAQNELCVLEFIHCFVEVLDKYFGQVCELDIMNEPEVVSPPLRLHLRLPLPPQPCTINVCVGGRVDMHGMALHMLHVTPAHAAAHEGDVTAAARKGLHGPQPSIAHGAEGQRGRGAACSASQRARAGAP